MIVTTTQYDQSFFLPLLRDPCVSCQLLFQQMSRNNKCDVWKDGFEARLVDEGIRSGRLRPTYLHSKDIQASHSPASEQKQQRPDQTQGTPTRTIRIEHDSFFGPPESSTREVKIRVPFTTPWLGFEEEYYPESVKGLPYRPPGETKSCKDKYSEHTVPCSGWTLNLSSWQWIGCGSPSTQHSRKNPDSEYAKEPFLIRELFGQDKPFGGICRIKETGERIMCPGWTGTPEARFPCVISISPHHLEHMYLGL